MRRTIMVLEDLRKKLLNWTIMVNFPDTVQSVAATVSWIDEEKPTLLHWNLEALEVIHCQTETEQ